MAGIVVFLEHNQGSLQKASLAALRAARELADHWKTGGISALCLGTSAEKAAEQALGFGFESVYFSEDPGFKDYRSVAYAKAAGQAMIESGAKVFVAAATTTGKDFCPRLAASMEMGQASDILSVNSDGSLRRPMYAGDVLADVEIVTENKLVTVRPTAFDPAEQTQAIGQKQPLGAVELPDYTGEFVSFEGSGGDRPELTEAECVVSGGRALQSEENFEKYIFPLADVLGAAVGASRAAVDSGYAPNDWQVGQTGKVVAPSLYIAVGISGAIQHIAGMKDSKVIVAINKDPDAPIFELADYGLVADLYQAVPELTEEIKKVKQS